MKQPHLTKTTGLTPVVHNGWHMSCGNGTAINY